MRRSMLSRSNCFARFRASKSSGLWIARDTLWLVRLTTQRDWSYRGRNFYSFTLPSHSHPYYKPMVKFLILILSVLINSAWGSDTYCLCQTGATPLVQTPAFWTGCQVWLRAQNECSEKRTDGFGGALELPRHWRNGTLRLGYVGHWDNANQTISVLRNDILPALADRRLNLDWRNSACGPMDDPEYVQNELPYMRFERGTFVRIIGAQTISMGQWSGLLPTSANVPATADSRRQQPSFPRCSDYQNEACLSRWQDGRRVTCVQPGGRLHLLECRNSGRNAAWTMVGPRPEYTD